MHAGSKESAAFDPAGEPQADSAPDRQTSSTLLQQQAGEPSHQALKVANSSNGTTGSSSSSESLSQRHLLERQASHQAASSSSNSSSEQQPSRPMPEGTSPLGSSNAAPLEINSRPYHASRHQHHCSSSSSSSRPSVKAGKPFRNGQLAPGPREWRQHVLQASVFEDMLLRLQVRESPRITFEEKMAISSKPVCGSL